MTGNGSTKLIWTIMVSACGLLTAGMMAWMTSLHFSLASVEASIIKSVERIASLEVALDTIDRRLNRIEDKLDRSLIKK